MSPPLEGRQTFATKAAPTLSTLGSGPGAVTWLVSHC